jgi:hypothetical protein
MTGHLNSALNYLLVLLLLNFTVGLAYGQEKEWDTFNGERYKRDKHLMLTLGSWSIANAGVSAYGWATTDNEAKYFHQMNVMWSGINLALAFPGYLKANKPGTDGLSRASIIQEQYKTEKIFLFNTGLDVGYVATGFWLKQRALNDPENYQRFRGWGNAVILQGGFLFLFDLSAYLIHANHRKNKLNPLLNQLDLSDNGLGLKWTF